VTNSQFISAIHLPEYTLAGGRVQIQYLSDSGTRSELTLPLLEAMLLLRQLETIRASVGIELTTDRHQ
jgi:hypothetical protein